MSLAITANANTYLYTTPRSSPPAVADGTIVYPKLSKSTSKASLKKVVDRGSVTKVPADHEKVPPVLNKLIALPTPTLISLNLQDN